MSHEIQPASSNLPQQKKVMPNWGLDYLAALNRAEGGLTLAAELIGKDYSTTFKGRLNYPELGEAVDELKREWDSHNLEILESISIQQAMKPGNMTERFFNMKALDSKYRDHAIPTPPTINIVVGFTIGKDTPSFAGPVTEIPAQVVGTKKLSKRGRKASDVLTDEDLDV